VTTQAQRARTEVHSVHWFGQNDASRLSVFEQVDDRAGMASAMFELSVLSLLQSEYGLAQQHYRRALATWPELGDCVGQADVLIQLGHICYRRGDTAQAQVYYSMAQQVSISTDEPT
jgi:tetratricopeptide (TPR) repeat protein